MSLNHKFLYKLFYATIFVFFPCLSHSQITVSNNRPVNQIEEALLNDMQSSVLMQRALSLLKDKIHFPERLDVVYGETPKKALRSGPYYANNKISVPYRYIFQLRNFLNKRKHIHQHQDLDQLVFSSLVFALLHEAGHALIDQKGINILGREEDMVDNFAIFLLLSEYPQGEEVLLATALVFDLQSRTSKRITDAQMQGVHRLHKQRFYTILCYLHGANNTVLPENYRALFSADRLKRCNSEYQRLYTSWKTVMQL